MPLDHLWATWRSAYVTGISDVQTVADPDGDELALDGRSLFERILEAPGSDDDKQIVLRSPRCFVILNRYPYTVGHLMVLPVRAVAHLEDLDGDEFADLWGLVRDAVTALKTGLGCDAVNVGINLGAAAGGSQADHLHVHCVPRWVGDANFMSVAAETRVLPMSLDEARERIRSSWPPGGGTPVP